MLARKYALPPRYVPDSTIKSACLDEDLLVGPQVERALSDSDPEPERLLPRRVVRFVEEAMERVDGVAASGALVGGGVHRGSLLAGALAALPVAVEQDTVVCLEPADTPAR